jgi:hypothetical protein
VIFVEGINHELLAAGLSAVLARRHMNLITLADYECDKYLVLGGV